MLRPLEALVVVWLVLACGGGAVDTDVADSDVDTDVADSDGDTDLVDDGVPGITLVALDPEGDVALAWVAWASSHGPVAVVAYDDVAATVGADDLVVFLPDLPRSASDHAERLVAHGGPVLGLGIGGARAYDGLDVGLGASDGGQGAVDAMEIDLAAVDHAVFAAITVPEDRVVTATDGAVADIGIRPSDGVTVLAWDYRYPGQFADLCHNDRFWYWGWGGGVDARPDVYTADGEAVLRAVFDELIADSK